jgi:dolichol-phosphate mannosyltransferase
MSKRKIPRERIVSVTTLNEHVPVSRVLVVTPTYNERGNIERLLTDISALDTPIDVLVADDGSPDGTADAVQTLAPSLARRVILMRRGGKYGFGVCYLDAFRWVEANTDYEVVVQMDADFSHDPQMLPLLIDRAKRYGIAIGSRYVEGGSTPDWDHRRVALSTSANFYVRTVLNLFYPSYPIRDNTAGFIAWRADVLEQVLKEEILGEGYAFLTVMKLIAFRLGYPATEIPITFRDRSLGESKLNRDIVIEAFMMPWRLGFSRRR